MELNTLWPEVSLILDVTKIKQVNKDLLWKDTVYCEMSCQGKLAAGFKSIRLCVFCFIFTYCDFTLLKT